MSGVAVAGDPEEDAVPKPVCLLSGADGNVFNAISLVRKALRGAGQDSRAPARSCHDFSHG